MLGTKSAGSQIAFVNPGGIRGALNYNYNGEFSYAGLFEVQPFRNDLITKTLSGSQLLRLLEQQWENRNGREMILGTSSGLKYRWDASLPSGGRVIADSITLNGKRVPLSEKYRVTANAFLAAGGDGFAAFSEGVESTVGMTDLQALENYIRAKHNLLDVDPAPAGISIN